MLDVVMGFLDAIRDNHEWHEANDTPCRW